MFVRVGLLLGVLILRPSIAPAEPVPTGLEFRVSRNRPVLGNDNQPAIASDAAGNLAKEESHDDHHHYRL